MPQTPQTCQESPTCPKCSSGCRRLQRQHLRLERLVSYRYESDVRGRLCLQRQTPPRLLATWTNTLTLNSWHLSLNSWDVHQPVPLTMTSTVGTLAVPMLACSQAPPPSRRHLRLGRLDQSSTCLTCSPTPPPSTATSPAGTSRQLPT